MADELKPCPFCEGEAKTTNGKFGIPKEWRILWGVFCDGDCGIFFDCRLPTEAMAVAAWNTRPAPKADGALVGELRAQAIHKESQTVVINRDLRDRILAALSDRDLVLEGLLRECRDVLDGLNDDEINVEFLPRIDAALKGGVDE